MNLEQLADYLSRPASAQDGQGDQATPTSC